MAETRDYFLDMLKEAGVPTTAEAMQSRWSAINAEQGGKISNDSAWSPFWRLISAMVTAPAQWLVTVLVDHALPNTFLKFATGKWLDLYAWGVDVKRKDATFAHGYVTFTRSSASGTLTIPAGTVIESPTINGTKYCVLTTDDFVIGDGILTANVPIIAEAAGEAYNLGAGYYSILTKPISGIESVTTGSDWLESAGADTEDDEALRLRTRNQFAAVGQYHHDAAYRALIAESAGIRTDYLFFEHDAPRGAGSANCYVMIESGVPHADMITAINAYIAESGNHGHGDDMKCFAIPAKPIAMAVTVYPVTNADDARCAALKTSVTNRVRCAFRENADFAMTKTFPVSRFSLSRLAEELHTDLADLASVAIRYYYIDEDADSTPTSIADDIVSTLQLPTLDSLTVTVAS